MTARLRPESAFCHKDAMVFSMPRENQWPSIELESGIWLRTDIPSLPVAGASWSGFITPLPAVLKDKARKVAIREWLKLSETHRKALRCPEEELLHAIFNLSEVAT
jgi:hypothetical protein